MKNLSTILLLLLSAMSFGQTKQQATVSDFSLQLSETTLKLNPGESKQFQLMIIRSKYYAKEKALLSANSLPAGITAVFEPAEGLFDTSTVTLSASPEILAGTHQIILNGILNHKTKGVILRLTVGNDQVAGK